jgi:multicomponent Na+:H+ antiporter subunit G
MLALVASLLVIVGGIFFFSGTLGLLRFPDTHSRLHALTKADTLGLGFIALGAALVAGSIAVALKLLIIWLLALAASSTVCHLIARLAKADEAS